MCSDLGRVLRRATVLDPYSERPCCVVDVAIAICALEDELVDPPLAACGAVEEQGSALETEMPGGQLRRGLSRPERVLGDLAARQPGVFNGAVRSGRADVRRGAVRGDLGDDA